MTDPVLNPGMRPMPGLKELQCPAAGGRFSRVPRVVADGWGQAGGGIAAIRANAATSCSTQGQVLGRRNRRRRPP